MTLAKQLKTTPKQSRVKSEIRPVYYLILGAYLFASTYLPDFNTVDSNGPKFLAMAVLNMVSLMIFLSDRKFRQREGLRSGFFRNLTGLAYTLFIIIALLSFTQAYNLSEAIINFAKLFTVFAATYVLYVIFNHNRIYILHLAVVFTFLLIFECFTVFYRIFEYVNKNVTSIYDIKSVYSHKNILSAALFIKLPASIWLMLFGETWMKKLGYLAFGLTALAILFMSSRAFYLGLSLLIIATAAFVFIRYYIAKKKLSAKKLLLFAGLFLIALLTFSMIQQYFYPTNRDTKEKFNSGFVERLSTIKTGETSANARLASWERSWDLIKSHPLLGVGTGNWKIQVLKYESPESATFIISYKNHNDFIETFAETGFFGGIAFLSIFILIWFIFISILMKPGSDEEKLKYLFLPAFGILAYSVDAFFNFPHDRPEIQVLFAAYVAMAIVASDYKQKVNAFIAPALDVSPTKCKSCLAIFSLFVFLLSICIVVLVLYAKSMYLQNIVFNDDNNNTYSHKSSFFIKGFPVIPDLSITGAPISIYITRYLENENRNKEVVSLLLNDNPSPYDGRREYYLSMAYDKLTDIDSAIYWGEKAYALKPLREDLVLVLSSRLFTQGKKKEAIQKLDQFLSQVKTNPDAWLQASDQNMMTGDERRALMLIDSAIKYFPQNKKIVDYAKSVRTLLYTKPYEILYKQANQAVAGKHYLEAIKLLNEFINKKPNHTEAYQTRALCHYYMHNYSMSLLDVEKAMNKTDGNKLFLINLRGVNFLGLGNKEAACRDFKKAMKKGNADGASNYQKFCLKND